MLRLRVPVADKECNSMNPNRYLDISEQLDWEYIDAISNPYTVV